MGMQGTAALESDSARGRVAEAPRRGQYVWTVHTHPDALMTERRGFVMRGTLLLALVLPALAHAQGGQPAIARLGITPAVRMVAVGDSLRLQVQAFDARGNVVPGVTIRFAAQGGRFQGSVDSAGVVRGGAPGTVPIAITAIAPNGSPRVEKVEVRIVPGPAARVTVSPSVTKMLAGQRLQLDATVLAASGDARDDLVTWTSSNTDVLTFAGGLLTAVGPGTATVTARAGQATTSLTIQVISSNGVTVTISPERANGRQGDVIRFAVAARDASGQRITGLTPTWSFAPGDGSISHDGTFVGNVPGKYIVTADLGVHDAQAPVAL